MPKKKQGEEPLRLHQPTKEATTRIRSRTHWVDVVAFRDLRLLAPATKRTDLREWEAESARLRRSTSTDRMTRPVPALWRRNAKVTKSL